MNADWFYSVGNTREGPVTEDELRQLVAAGKLAPADLVWRDGMPDWVEAHTVDVLFPPSAPPQADDRMPRRGFDDRPQRREYDDLDDDRPAVRSRRRRYDEDDRPIRRARRDDFVDDDEPPPRRRDYDNDYGPKRRSPRQPGQIQAVGIMMLCGGIFGILVFLGFASTCIGLVWPGIYFELVIGILAIVRAANMLGRDDQGPPKTLAIMLILCIVNADFVNYAQESSVSYCSPTSKCRNTTERRVSTSCRDLTGKCEPFSFVLQAATVR